MGDILLSSDETHSDNDSDDSYKNDESDDSNFESTSNNVVPENLKYQRKK